MKYLLVILAIILLVVVWDRVSSALARRRAETMVRRIAQDLREGSKPAPNLENPRYGRISLTPQEITVAHPGGAVLWMAIDSVQRITAYKTDQGVVDLIHLLFVGSGEPPVIIDIHEEMVGFQDLMNRLPDLFPGLNEAWFLNVAFPAFEPQWTEVWAKPGTKPAEAPSA